MQGGFRQQHADELLSHVEGQTALRVGDLGARDRGLIAGGLQTSLPLVAALKEVRDSNVELLGQVQIVG